MSIYFTFNTYSSTIPLVSASGTIGYEYPDLIDYQQALDSVNFIGVPATPYAESLVQAVQGLFRGDIGYYAPVFPGIIPLPVGATSDVVTLGVGESLCDFEAKANSSDAGHSLVNIALSAAGINTKLVYLIRQTDVPALGDTTYLVLRKNYICSPPVYPKYLEFAAKSLAMNDIFTVKAKFGFASDISYFIARAAMFATFFGNLDDKGRFDALKSGNNAFFVWGNNFIGNSILPGTPPVVYQLDWQNPNEPLMDAYLLVPGSMDDRPLFPGIAPVISGSESQTGHAYAPANTVGVRSCRADEYAPGGANPITNLDFPTMNLVDETDEFYVDADAVYVSFLNDDGESTSNPDLVVSQGTASVIHSTLADANIPYQTVSIAPTKVGTYYLYVRVRHPKQFAKKHSAPLRYYNGGGSPPVVSPSLPVYQSYYQPTGIVNYTDFVLQIDVDTDFTADSLPLVDSLIVDSTTVAYDLNTLAPTGLSGAVINGPGAYLNGLNFELYTTLPNNTVELDLGGTLVYVKYAVPEANFVFKPDINHVYCLVIDSSPTNEGRAPVCLDFRSSFYKFNDLYTYANHTICSSDRKTFYATIYDACVSGETSVYVVDFIGPTIEFSQVNIAYSTIVLQPTIEQKFSVEDETKFVLARGTDLPGFCVTFQSVATLANYTVDSVYAALESNVGPTPDPNSTVTPVLNDRRNFTGQLDLSSFEYTAAGFTLSFSVLFQCRIKASTTTDVVTVNPSLMGAAFLAGYYAIGPVITLTASSVMPALNTKIASLELGLTVDLLDFSSARKIRRLVPDLVQIDAPLVTPVPVVITEGSSVKKQVVTARFTPDSALTYTARVRYDFAALSNVEYIFSLYVYNKPGISTFPLSFVWNASAGFTRLQAGSATVAVADLTPVPRSRAILPKLTVNTSNSYDLEFVASSAQRTKLLIEDSGSLAVIAAEFQTKARSVQVELPQLLPSYNSKQVYSVGISLLSWALNCRTFNCDSDGSPCANFADYQMVYDLANSSNLPSSGVDGDALFRWLWFVEPQVLDASVQNSLALMLGNNAPLAVPAAHTYRTLTTQHRWRDPSKFTIRVQFFLVLSPTLPVEVDLPTKVGKTWVLGFDLSSPLSGLDPQLVPGVSSLVAELKYDRLLANSYGGAFTLCDGASEVLLLQLIDGTSGPLSTATVTLVSGLVYVVSASGLPYDGVLTDITATSTVVESHLSGYTKSIKFLQQQPTTEQRNVIASVDLGPAYRWYVFDISWINQSTTDSYDCELLESAGYTVTFPYSNPDLLTGSYVYAQQDGTSYAIDIDAGASTITVQWINGSFDYYHYYVEANLEVNAQSDVSVGVESLTFSAPYLLSLRLNIRHKYTTVLTANLALSKSASNQPVYVRGITPEVTLSISPFPFNTPVILSSNTLNFLNVSAGIYLTSTSELLQSVVISVSILNNPGLTHFATALPASGLATSVDVKAAILASYLAFTTDTPVLGDFTEVEEYGAIADLSVVGAYQYSYKYSGTYWVISVYTYSSAALPNLVLSVGSQQLDLSSYFPVNFSINSTPKYMLATVADRVLTYEYAANNDSSTTVSFSLAQVNFAISVVGSVRVFTPVYPNVTTLTTLTLNLSSYSFMPVAMTPLNTTAVPAAYWGASVITISSDESSDVLFARVDGGVISLCLCYLTKRVSIQFIDTYKLTPTSTNIGPLFLGAPVTHSSLNYNGSLAAALDVSGDPISTFTLTALVTGQFTVNYLAPFGVTLKVNSRDVSAVNSATLYVQVGATVSFESTLNDTFTGLPAGVSCVIITVSPGNYRYTWSVSSPIVSPYPSLAFVSLTGKIKVNLVDLATLNLDLEVYYQDVATLPVGYGANSFAPSWPPTSTTEVFQGLVVTGLSVAAPLTTLVSYVNGTTSIVGYAYQLEFVSTSKFVVLRANEQFEIAASGLIPKHVFSATSAPGFVGSPAPGVVTLQYNNLLIPAQSVYGLESNTDKFTPLLVANELPNFISALRPAGATSNFDDGNYYEYSKFLWVNSDTTAAFNLGNPSSFSSLPSPCRIDCIYSGKDALGVEKLYHETIINYQDTVASYTVNMSVLATNLATELGITGAFWSDTISVLESGVIFVPLVSGSHNVIFYNKTLTSPVAVYTLVVS